MRYKTIELPVQIKNYKISICINKPDDFQTCIIIANGSGGNMHSEFISRFHIKLAEVGFMTVKFNFHYQEVRRKIPDRNDKCQETYSGVVDYLVEKENILLTSIVPGGKSMGGRIATQIAGHIKCKKIIVFGYPLHPPGNPSKLRDEHLYGLEQDILFFQGERDSFGTKDEMEPIIAKMKHAKAYFIPMGDHSLKAPKKSGLSSSQIDEKIIEELKLFCK